MQYRLGDIYINRSVWKLRLLSFATVVVFSSELILLRRFDIAVLMTVYSPLSLYIISDVKSSCCMGAERSVNKSVKLFGFYKDQY